MADQDPISIFDLKQLLIELYEVRPDTRIKIRLGNEPWTPNFLSIIHLAGLTNNPPDFQGVIFNDEALQKLVLVKDLQEIRQFIIDKSFPGYKRNVEYNIKREITNVE